MGTKEPEPEVREPGGRKYVNIGEMSTEDLAAAYGHGTQLRSHGLNYGQLDEILAGWLRSAREELGKRNQLDTIKEHLAVYFDPSRTPAVFGPGAALVSQAAFGRAIAPAPRALKSAGLWQVEGAELRDMHLAREYAIMRPVSLLDPRLPRPWPISPPPSASCARTTSSLLRAANEPDEEHPS